MGILFHFLRFLKFEFTLLSYFLVPDVGLAHHEAEEHEFTAPFMKPELNKIRQVVCFHQDEVGPAPENQNQLLYPSPFVINVQPMNGEIDDGTLPVSLVLLKD